MRIGVGLGIQAGVFALGQGVGLTGLLAAQRPAAILIVAGPPKCVDAQLPRLKVPARLSATLG